MGKDNDELSHNAVFCNSQFQVTQNVASSSTPLRRISGRVPSNAGLFVQQGRETTHLINYFGYTRLIVRKLVRGQMIQISCRPPVASILFRYLGEMADWLWRHQRFELLYPAIVRPILETQKEPTERASICWRNRVSVSGAKESSLVIHVQ